KMAEGYVDFNQQLIEESQAGIETMAKNGMAKFVRNDGGQTGFIGKHVDQPSAQHDGVADSVGFQCRSRHHSAAHIGFYVDVVGDLEIVDYRLERFVDFALRRDQPDTLQPVDHVIFRL